MHVLTLELLVQVGETNALIPISYHGLEDNRSSQYDNTKTEERGKSKIGHMRQENANQP